MTTIAASTALVTTTPIWTVVLDRLRGRPVPRGVLVGVAVAMCGVLLVTGVDAGRSGRALAGRPDRAVGRHGRCGLRDDGRERAAQR